MCATLAYHNVWRLAPLISLFKLSTKNCIPEPIEEVTLDSNPWGGG